MALQVNITNIAQVTYPVDVYVCRDCPDTDCTLVDTINSVPATITIPGPYSGYSSFGVKIIDAKDCEYCQIFPTGTTTTSSTSTTTTLNPLCVSCDIGFDYYDTNPISQISVGLVTASCDPSLTDYVIDWYGPGVGSTTVAFTSGYGSDYTGDYLYTHPLIGTSAVPVVAGIYTPIIQKIKINGVEYTDLNCFNSTTVDVDALTCINGSPTDVPQYSHKISFDATVNIIPQPVLTTFALDPLKPYFAYRFDGKEIYDTLKITFYGSNYSDPIVVEYLEEGYTLVDTDFDLTLTPKRAKPIFNVIRNYFPKVLNLSNFIINSGDYLEIEIIPNPINNNTSWKFYCECLETFNCDVCYDTNISSPYKIIESSINVTTPDACGVVSVRFDLSGCSDSDIKKYMSIEGPGFDDTVFNGSYYFADLTPLAFINISPTPQIYCSVGGTAYLTTCDTPSTSTITYSKTVPGPEGLISMTFTDFNDLLTYYNDWQNMMISYSGNPTNCLDIDYYRFFLLKIPLAVGNNNCGDTTGYEEYKIHPSAVVTTGGTGPWTMTITMPTISSCLSFTNCETGCQTSMDIVAVDAINDSSTGITNNISITNNTGSKLIKPIISIGVLSQYSSNIYFQTQTISLAIPKYVNETIPYSGTPLTIIPSLSAETCNLSNWEYDIPVNPNNGYYIYYSVYLEVRVVNPLNPQDFEIWTRPIVSGIVSPVWVKIYEYIGGVPNVIDPSYFI
jgi:hypothetical protein